METQGLHLEHIPPNDPGNEVVGDVWERLKASRARLAAQDTREFDMPLAGLIVRYRRQGIEAYRRANDTDTEWESWAQLLIDHCDGFRLVDSNEDLLDLDQQPLRYYTLAERLELPIDEDGARGLVRDVFTDENTMVTHAQRVDAWLSQSLADHEADLAKGS